MLEQNLREYISIEHVGSTSIPGREVFDEDNVSMKIAHHLYVCEKDNPELLRHIAFRK